MSYKLGFYTTSSPFFGSKIAFWRHHDTIFRRLCQDDNLEIHVILPAQGGEKFIEKLYNGDHSVLYPTLREMNIVFHTDFSLTANDLDGLYLDDIHTVTDAVIHGQSYTRDQQLRYLESLIHGLMHLDKPILMSDTDGFCTETLEGVDADMRVLYEKYNHYRKFYVTSPFINTKILETIGDRFHMIPFEVDPRDLRDIKPLSQREYILRYVGNQYYREHFVPLFERLSQLGKVRVNGAGWNPHKAQAPAVLWTNKISMSPSNVYEVYSNSAIGLTGRSSYNALKDQVIYLYRWKEYLSAGTLIIPENLPEYTSILPRGSLTTDDILLNYPHVTNYFRSMKDNEYEILVRRQRDEAMKFFGVDVWLPLFKSILEVS